MMTDPVDMPRFNPAQAGASDSALWVMPGDSMDVNYKVLGKDRADAFYPAGSPAPPKVLHLLGNPVSGTGPQR